MTHLLLLFTKRLSLHSSVSGAARVRHQGTNALDMTADPRGPLLHRSNRCRQRSSAALEAMPRNDKQDQLKKHPCIRTFIVAVRMPSQVWHCIEHTQDQLLREERNLPWLQLQPRRSLKEADLVPHAIFSVLCRNYTLHLSGMPTTLRAGPEYQKQTRILQNHRAKPVDQPGDCMQQRGRAPRISAPGAVEDDVGRKIEKKQGSILVLCTCCTHKFSPKHIPPRA